MFDFPVNEKGDYYKHMQCPDCGSSDALAFYPWSGDTHCFSCKKTTKNKYKMDSSNKGVVLKDADEEILPWESEDESKELGTTTYNTVIAPLYQRKLSMDTVTKYGVKSDIDQYGNLCRIQFPYFSKEGEQIATKFNVPATEHSKKKFWTEGNIKDAMLFGQTKFQHGWKTVTITEGELDAMSANQMLGIQAPCVSIKLGAGSVKKGFENIAIYDWLNSFDKIVVSFDNDEVGKEAIKEITQLFSPEKIHVMNLKYKDANEYLMQGKAEDFVREWRAAKPAILEGIKNLSESRDHALKPANVEKVNYPWKKLNDLTRGIRMGECTTILAGTGVGKTSVCQELVYHLLTSTSFKLGCMFIENSERDTVNNIVGTAMSFPLRFALENEEELANAIFEYDAKHGQGAFIAARDKAMAETVDSGRLWSIADTDYTVNNMDKILNRCRYFAKVLGCKVIFLDHISLLVSGGEHDGDERKALDEIATKLAMIVKELGIHLFIVSQANTPTSKSLEEGGRTSVNGVRGTRGVGHITHNMLGIERNGQAEDADERNTTLIRVLKCRWSGRTGPSSSLLFSHETYRLKEIDLENPTNNEDIDLSTDKDYAENVTEFPSKGI